MILDICGVPHPTYKKLWCTLGPSHKSPHSAPIRRGQWVNWLVAGIGPKLIKEVVESAPATLRILLLENEDYGRIGSKSKGRCWYCGLGFSSLKRTLDHVVPRSKGGPNDPSNLVFACQPCNTAKASMSLEFYRLHVQRTQQRERVIFYGETLNTACTTDLDAVELHSAGFSG